MALTFQSLQAAFTSKNTAFENFEKSHKAKLPQTRREYEEVLKKLTETLSQFASLQYDFVQLEVPEKDREFKIQHIDAINIVINRIQYIYIMPLSLELGRNYNKFNFKIAVASILIGAAIPYLISGIANLISTETKVSETSKAKPIGSKQQKLSPAFSKPTEVPKIKASEKTNVK